MSQISEQQLEKWRGYLIAMRQDDAFMEEVRANHKRRSVPVAEFKQLFAPATLSQLDVSGFRQRLSAITVNHRATFGLHGNYTMFVNMLAKHIGNDKDLKDGLLENLFTALQAPKSIDEAHDLLTGFFEYLMHLLALGKFTRKQVEPSLTPYFFSVAWHMQNIERWPIFYPYTRKSFEREQLFKPSGDKITDYFVFRDVYLELAQQLKLSSWELESICIWLQRQTEPVIPIPKEPEPETPVSNERQHSQIQWLLAQLGQRFGYKVWIARNDRKYTWNGEALGNYSIDELPYFNGIGPKSQQMIELIDVVWLKGKAIVAAFEVEGSTSIYSGLLRMSDLAIALENTFFPFYVVVPERREHEVEAQLSRLTFQKLRLHERCSYVTFEALITHAESMMTFATSVRAIDKIARTVEAIDLDDE